MAFNPTEYFDGELYKLATPKGVDKKQQIRLLKSIKQSRIKLN